MTLTQAPRRQKPAVRRFGYVVAVLVNAALLYAANVWPGWEKVPVLTAETSRVLGLVNASIVVGIVANLVYLARDPAWLKGLGDAVTTTVGLAAMVRMWQVFPFDFAEGSFDWAVLARILLGLGIAGSAIGIVTGLVGFGRGLARR